NTLYSLVFLETQLRPCYTLFPYTTLFRSVFLGNGSGGFTAAANSLSLPGVFSESLAAADIDGDGNLDLVVTTGGKIGAVVLLGNGQGQFTQPSWSPLALDNVSFQSVIADLNGDGRPDLVFPENGPSPNPNVAIYLGSTGLVVTAAGYDSLAVGQIMATITLTVQNLSDGEIGGTVTVIESLPAGLEILEAGGPGW